MIARIRWYAMHQRCCSKKDGLTAKRIMMQSQMVCLKRAAILVLSDVHNQSSLMEEMEILRFIMLIY